LTFRLALCRRQREFRLLQGGFPDSAYSIATFIAAITC
jgi:hypothetical protein